ncbi:sensor histidine kinase [Sphingomonas sp. ID0503]|uniref:sensor histidine kinase n=1 Tax=Sphingomonas sp. ID0503 TaxID=3399691 RepID=UPI003AFAC477
MKLDAIQRSAEDGQSMRIDPLRSRTQVPWSQALRLSAGLWLFVALIFLPLIIARHTTDTLASVALDCSTFLVSIALSMPLFALFRGTANLSAPRRLTLWTVAVLAASAAQILFDLAFQQWVADNVNPNWGSMPANLVRAWQSGLNYVLVFAVNMGLFQLALIRRRALAQERHFAAIQSSTQQAQIAALRFQVNPHFLFNTLNAISSLIVAQRNEDAEQVVNQLSDFLRSTATIRPDDLIAVEEEFAFVERYLEIEGVRFGERLASTVDCAPAVADRMIPALTIQTIVMSAVDHAVSLTRERVSLSVRASRVGEGLRITVETSMPPGVLTGLDDVDDEIASAEARLTAHYGGAARLVRDVTEDRFAVIITIAEG